MADKKPWYLGQSPPGAGYAHFSNVAWRQTVLDAKTKELTGTNSFLTKHL